MNQNFKLVYLAAMLGAAAIALAGCAGSTAYTDTNVQVTLSGDQEVPPVSTWARGKGAFSVSLDGSVSGSVSLMGITATAAHIHVAPRGRNGPVAIGLVKSNEQIWVVPAGARFTELQRKAFMVGETYVNVHTDAHKGGEIRAQLDR